MVGEGEGTVLPGSEQAHPSPERYNWRKRLRGFETDSTGGGFNNLG
jgi:hypothetical protein